MAVGQDLALLHSYLRARGVVQRVRAREEEDKRDRGNSLRGMCVAQDAVWELGCIQNVSLYAYASEA